MKQTGMKDILVALQGMTLSMKAHPDCQPDSEFQDMVDRAEKALNNFYESPPSTQEEPTTQKLFEEHCHADLHTGACDSRICCLNPGFIHRGIQNGLKEIQDSINADWDSPDAMRGHINGIIKSMQYSVTTHHERQKAYMQGVREDDSPYPN